MSLNNPGIIYVPYVIQTSVATISGFTPSSHISSRYSIRGFWPKNHKRLKKIKNILNEKTLS